MIIPAQCLRVKYRGLKGYEMEEYTNPMARWKYIESLASHSGSFPNPWKEITLNKTKPNKYIT